MILKNLKINSKIKKNKLKFKDFFIIAGSFNEKTKKQVSFFKSNYNLKILEQTNIFEFYTNYKNIHLIKTPDDLQKNYSIKNINIKILDILSNNNNKNTLFVLAGGETAYNFTNLLKIQKLDMVDIIDTGIVLCKDKKSKINLILKSGGFGEENFFEEVFKKFIDI